MLLQPPTEGELRTCITIYLVTASRKNYGYTTAIALLCVAQTMSWLVTVRHIDIYNKILPQFDIVRWQKIQHQLDYFVLCAYNIYISISLPVSVYQYHKKQSISVYNTYISISVSVSVSVYQYQNTNISISISEYQYQYISTSIRISVS